MEFPNGWFSEIGVLNSDDVRTSIKMDKILHESKSKFQEIRLFTNKVFGRCLVLDDAIQCTEMDECSYQEMMTFLPLNLHSNPKNVLIIGGGDGGVAREVSKHPLVERVVQCEIDQDVVNLSKKFLPFMGVGFESDKLELHIDDGYKYVQDHRNQFDVIITDSSDPKGPAVTLFQTSYYQSLFNCLRPNGIICCQAESYWFDLEFIKNLVREVSQIFPSVSYASTAVASYPSGQIGFLIASKEEKLNFQEPRYHFSEQDCENMKLKFYSNEMHRSAFTLPAFVRKQLNEAMKI